MRANKCALILLHPARLRALPARVSATAFHKQADELAMVCGLTDTLLC